MKMYAKKLSTSTLVELEKINGTEYQVKEETLSSEAPMYIIQESQLSEYDILSHYITNDFTVLNDKLSKDGDKIILGTNLFTNEMVIKLTSGKYSGFYLSISEVHVHENDIYHSQDLIFNGTEFVVKSDDFVTHENKTLKLNETLKNLLFYFNDNFLDLNVDQVKSVLSRSKSLVKLTFGKYQGYYVYKDQVVVLPNGDKVSTKDEVFKSESGEALGLLSTPERYGYFLDQIDLKYYELSQGINLVIESGKEVKAKLKDTFLHSRCFSKYFLNEEAARSHNFVLCSLCNDWEPEGYHNPELFGYHSRNGRANLIGDSTYGIGIEVEKEDLEIKRLLNSRKVLNETGWACERDGSLDGSSGFEAISPALPLDVTKKITDQKDWIETYIKPVEHLLNAKYSSNCGGKFVAALV